MFIDSEQDPPTENRPSQTHGRATPETSDASIRKNASECVNSASTCCALRSRFDGVKWLSGVGSDNAGDGTVGEVGRSALLNVAPRLEIFEDVVCPHAKGGG